MVLRIQLEFLARQRATFFFLGGKEGWIKSWERNGGMKDI